MYEFKLNENYNLTEKNIIRNYAKTKMIDTDSSDNTMNNDKQQKVIEAKIR